MENVVLVIHLILALAIIGLVLIQRSEGGGLGIGGSSGGGMGGFATAQGTANALTKLTRLCAAGFFATSLALAVLAGTHNNSRGILESYPAQPASVENMTDEENSQATNTDESAITGDELNNLDTEAPIEKPSAPLGE